jgi:hypothetical protein
MKTTEPLVFARYFYTLTYTIMFFFQRPLNPETLIEWLQPLVSDQEDRALLMHEEPLYVAADFLGIDRLSPKFRETEQKYQQFKVNLASPRHGMRFRRQNLPKI